MLWVGGSPTFYSAAPERLCLFLPLGMLITPVFLHVEPCFAVVQQMRFILASWWTISSLSVCLFLVYRQWLVFDPLTACFYTLRAGDLQQPGMQYSRV